MRESRDANGWRLSLACLAVVFAVFTFSPAVWPAVCLANGSSEIAADPTARIDAQIYVKPHRVRMVLSQFTDDLVWLHGMEADERGLFSAEQLRQYYQLHKEFLGNQLHVIDVQGQRLKAILVEEGPYPFDDALLQEGATEFHLVRRRMQFTYEYESPEVVLDTFTIRHSVVDENFLYPAELSLDLFQGESDLSLKGKLRLDAPMTVDLDWENPVPNLAASDEEKRAWLERQDERLLGVTNFGAVYQWAYLEPRQLRVELLIPLNVLATLFEINGSEPDFLQGEELAATEQRIRKYFSAGNPVSINGQVVTPTIQRVDYFPADQRDFALRTKVERISLANGRVGVSLAYNFRAVPREITLAWDKFSYALNSVQAYLYFGQEVKTQVFSRQLADNRLVWTNAGEVPEPAAVVPVAVQESDWATESAGPGRGLSLWLLVAGVGAMMIGAALLFGRRQWSAWCTPTVLFVAAATVLGGALLQRFATGLMPPQVAVEAGDRAAGDLLRNVYRAFDFVDEEEIYAALETSVAGGKLRDLYLELLQDLQVEEQGGAVSRIEAVEVLAVETVDQESAAVRLDDLGVAAESGSGAAFRRRVKWNLSGLLEHWGHTHQRTNQYQAVLTIADQAGQWKVVDLTVESQTAGVSQPRPGRFRPARSGE